MKRLFCSLFMLLTVTAFAQSPALTAEQTQRLARFSQLYTHIRFFHPAPGVRTVPLDSMYAETAPQLINAHDPASQAEIINRFLAVLNDPQTRAEKTQPSLQTYNTGSASDSLQFFLDADSILVVKTNNHYGFDDVMGIFGQMEGMQVLAASCKGILFDFRARQPIRTDVAGYLSYIFNSAEVAGNCIAAPIHTHSHRKRMHNGFVPENGSTSGGYYSGFYTVGNGVIRPAPTSFNVPVAVLINEYSDVPLHALALSQVQGNGLFVCGDISKSMPAETATFAFSPEINVFVRVSDLMAPDGSMGIGKAYAFPEANAWEASEKAAHAFLTGKDTGRKPQSGATTAALEIPEPTSYPPGAFPSLGYRLLAGAKIWGTIHYFFAYKDLIPGNWDQTLIDYLPALAGARDSLEYAMAVAKMYRNIQDGHGFITSKALRDYIGAVGVPCIVRFIEGKAVVTEVALDSAAQAIGFQVGDVILEINGEKTEDRTKRIGSLFAASNEWTRNQYVTWRLLRGREGDTLTVKVLDRKNKEKTVKYRLAKTGMPRYAYNTADTVKILQGNIGYVDLGRLSGEHVDAMFEKLKDTRAIIFDMRGYPNGTAWQIAPRLTEKSEVVAARFARYNPSSPDITTGDMSGAETKYHFLQHIPANIGKPVYKGKTVMLIDERTQSQAEHTGLFFEAANGTEFIGSPTAGANGDVTNFSIPGGISLSFSGHDVRHADGRQLQQVGLQPNVLVRPTIKGIRAGKDEVLDAAVRYLNTKH